MPNSSDYFTEAFNRSINLAQQIDTQKRLEQVSQMQMMMQALQMQELMRKQAVRQAMVKQYADVPGFQMGPPNVEAGDNPIGHSMTPTMTESPAMRSLLSQYPQELHGAVRAAAQSGDFDTLKQLKPEKQLGPTDQLLQSIIDEERRKGTPTLEIAQKIQQIKQQQKEFNIPAEVDTFLMGIPQFKGYASDPAVRAKAVDWLSTPDGQRAYKSWWTNRKLTVAPTFNVFPGYQDTEGNPLVLNSRTGNWEPAKPKKSLKPSEPGAKPPELQKTPSEADIKEARTAIGITSIINEIKSAFEKAKDSLPTSPEDRVTGYAQRMYKIKTQSDPNLVLANSLAEGFLAKFARASGEVGVLTEGDITRARANQPSIHDTPEVRNGKFENLQKLYQEIYERGKRQKNPLGKQNKQRKSLNDIWGK